MYGQVNRHKVFISYHHDNDQEFKNELLRLNEWYNLFDDYSVGDGDIEDGLSAETIRHKIRDDFIKNASVMILLCGEKTKNRKHIDWEIHASMYNTENNPRLGIVVINLPSVEGKNYLRATKDIEKEIISPNSHWVKCDSREECEQKFPYLPNRIIDNLSTDRDIVIVNWSTITNNLEGFKVLIDEAFKRRKTMTYDTSSKLRRNNS